MYELFHIYFTSNLITVLLFAGVKGFNANQPGYSCKDIRDSGDSKGDGEYWIDPEKGAHPFKVFCDMTTDGGNLRLGQNITWSNRFIFPWSTSFYLLRD